MANLDSSSLFSAFSHRIPFLPTPAEGDFQDQAAALVTAVNRSTARIAGTLECLAQAAEADDSPSLASAIASTALDVRDVAGIAGLWLQTIQADRAAPASVDPADWFPDAKREQLTLTRQEFDDYAEHLHNGVESFLLKIKVIEPGQETEPQATASADAPDGSD